MSGRYGPLKPTTTIIGTQEWALRNLDVTTYRDGTPIPEVQNNAAWTALTTGAWCYYNNDPANGAIYGKLYNGYAVNDPRGLAPVGYHIPSNAEWDILIDYLGGDRLAGGKLKESGTIHWASPNNTATNSSGWTGLPGGYRSSIFGTFSSINYLGVWATSTIAFTYYYALSYFLNSVDFNSDGPRLGFSVRCLKD
jgi:uncharacterized protein (TIGR02145 family)